MPPNKKAASAAPAAAAAQASAPAKASARRYGFNVRTAALVALAAAATYGLRVFFAGGVNPHTAVPLAGRTYIVTGANTGIGLETAQELARLNATVVLACRDAGRCDAAVARIRAADPDARVEAMALDLSDLDSVRAFAAAFKAKHSALHGLVNNAGVMMCPLSRTAQGFELQLGTNHLGHYLLTHLLLDVLKASAPSRIINVSSRAHEQGSIDLEDLNFERRGYSPYVAYAQSKLANVLFTRSLARRLQGSGVTAVSLHPGVIRTELMRHIPWAETAMAVTAPVVNVFTKSPWEGAQTQLYAALAPEAEVAPLAGAYLADCRAVASSNGAATDDQLAESFWAASARMVGVTWP
jgi:retinol dehydrogenase-12